MIPSTTIARRAGILMGADTAGIGSADGLNVGLIKIPFTPSPAFVRNGATMDPTTPGLVSPLDAGAAPMPATLDPNTGDQQIRIKEPAGGWTWTASAVATPPEHIYGYWVANADSGAPIGCAAFDEPQLIGEIGDAVTIGQITITIPAASFS